jgi:sorbitol-specific phosphotransferase system component IIBC
MRIKNLFFVLFISAVPIVITGCGFGDGFAATFGVLAAIGVGVLAIGLINTWISQ